MMVGREVTRRKSGAKGRRTQAERSASTKAHILETTFECLAEVGFAGTTTVLICEHGNISRGALLHHYSTKTALVSATVEYVFERRLDAFREAIISLPSGADRREVAIDLLWEQFSSRTFYVWLELLVAARTDSDLRDTTARVGRSFSGRARDLNAELFPGLGDTQAGGLLLKITFALMNGMAVDRIIPDETPVEVILDFIKMLGPAFRSGTMGSTE